MPPPVEPPPTHIRFPSVEGLGEVIAIGCDFRPGTVLEAYRNGIFPWPQGGPKKKTDEPLVAWCSPNPRAIFPLDRPAGWSRSLARTLRRHPYEITIDQVFAGVMRRCGETRPSTWIIPELVDGYLALFSLGWAHSVEVWEGGPGRELVGGIYGLALGGLFAGESMFHTRTDASKIAFASLVDRLHAGNFSLFDVQVRTSHLASLGCVNVARPQYLRLVQHALGVQAALR